VPSKTHRIIGNILINIPVPEIQTKRQRGSICSGDDYVKGQLGNRFKVGSQVVVKNRKGEVIGMGNLGHGIYLPTTSKKAITQFRLEMPGSEAIPLSCFMSFAVENIPVSDWYTIEIGEDNIGMSSDLLESHGYKVDYYITKYVERLWKDDWYWWFES